MLAATAETERTLRELKAAHKLAMQPVIEFHRAQQRAALAEVRDALRQLDRGAMRKLLGTIEAAREAGVYAAAHELVPPLWRAGSTGETALDVWQSYHERNGNL